MKHHTWKLYALFIVLTEAVGGLSAFLTRDGVRVFQQTAAQPPLSPPPAAFPIVWAVLYALMGVGAARVFLTPPSAARSRALLAFGVQLALNFFWSILFFNLRAYGLALVWLALLWLAVLWMLLSFRRVDRPAAWLQVPYLLWASFAAYLTAGVWLLN